MIPKPKYPSGARSPQDGMYQIIVRMNLSCIGNIRHISSETETISNLFLDMVQIKDIDKKYMNSMGTEHMTRDGDIIRIHIHYITSIRIM
jgi:hypothetical protein